MRTLNGETRPARVCFLIDELATAGTETQLLALIRHLDRRRVQPYLVLLRGDSPLSQSLEPAECHVLRLGVGSLKHPLTAVRALKFAQFLWRERIDIVQAYFPDSSYFGVPAAFLAGVPHRVRTRNNIGHWMTKLHRYLGRVLNSFTTATIANCDAARTALIEDERPNPGRVLVLPNGVDLDRFLDVPLPVTTDAKSVSETECPGCVSREGARPGDLHSQTRLTQPGHESTRLTQPWHTLVGTVANLRHVKGLDLLMDAASRLKGEFPQVSYRVAGEGEYRAELEARIDSANLCDRFHLPGACNDVPAFLASLDVAVLPSRAEGMSNAVLEYMAAARPIVATAVGATPEMIRDGEHGLLVPPGDAGALASAIGRLLRDRPFAAKLGEAARQRAIEQYSRAAMVRRFEEFYTRLIHNREMQPCRPTC